LFKLRRGDEDLDETLSSRRRSKRKKRSHGHRTKEYGAWKDYGDVGKVYV